MLPCHAACQVMQPPEARQERQNQTNAHWIAAGLRNAARTPSMQPPGMLACWRLLCRECLYLRGVGVDCAPLTSAVLRAAGLL